MPALAALLVGVIAVIGIFASGWLPWGFWEEPPAAAPHAHTAAVIEAADVPTALGSPFTDEEATDAVVRSSGRVLGETASLAIVPTAYPVAATVPAVAASTGVSPSFLAQFSQFLQSFSAYLATPAAVSGSAYPRYGGYLPQTGGTTALSSPSITGGTITNASSGSFDALSAGTLALSSALTGTDATFTGTLTAGTLSVAGVSSGGAITGPYFTATSTTATSSFAGGFTAASSAFTILQNGKVGVGTTSPRADLHIAGNGQIMVQNGNTLQERSGDFWMTSNAYYDGANWQRQNASKVAFGLDLRGNNNLPNESEQGATLWVAQSAANPIGSTFGAVGGWELGWALTASRNLVVGGMGLELDGNGLTPYGRIVHNNSLSTVNTGIAKNVYADFSGRDASAQPSWFAGFVDDAFKVRRLAGSAAISNGNFSSLLSLDSSGTMAVTGNLGIGTTTPWGRLSVLAADNSSAPQFVVASSTATALFVGANGNVGIGTTTPTGILTVAGESGVSIVVPDENSYQLTFDTYASTPANGWGFWTDDTTGALKIDSGVGGSQITRFSLMPSGNLGIGTTTPWGKLSVTGSGTGTGLAFAVADSANTPRFVIQDNGNVGIGTTSPSQLFSVAVHPDL
jgi:hypothetical protein